MCWNCWNKCWIYHVFFWPRSSNNVDLTECFDRSFSKSTVLTIKKLCFVISKEGRDSINLLWTQLLWQVRTTIYINIYIYIHISLDPSRNRPPKDWHALGAYGLRRSSSAPEDSRGDRPIDSWNRNGVTIIQTQPQHKTQLEAHRYK